MSHFVLQWEIRSQDAGKMIREFLKEKSISKAALTDIKFKGGRIAVNSQDVNVRYYLKDADQLTVHFPMEEPSEGLAGEDIPLDIRYEDDYILIVNKPSEMNTIPSREHPTGSLANALIGYFNKIGLQATTHIVTRLDRNTSGLVLIAKHRHIHHLLSREQKAGRIQRTYEAFAEGVFKEKFGKVEEPIGRKEDSIIEREVREDGQYALTHYQVIQPFPRFTWLKLQLETGRTHQIRVHLSYIGHPLAGDTLYGGHIDLIKRQALHCQKIMFTHPILGSPFEFTAELPSDMQSLLEID
ncbi:RluA family pseudouridine synthase [Niallia endozanthoxylica]|uniref:Pseudouridine synthase n=1 Tax=Niallia endozanthoxylica TaxID=2036016 RepID=A0A5J5I1H7_9BACI|nr:RluA family pseudouridine synthase [Niallia endozanthoxylica]KAA9027576.1 RluA family pseudouridine synthase [Niallia endozanthoxylica]